MKFKFLVVNLLVIGVICAEDVKELNENVRNKGVTKRGVVHHGGGAVFPATYASYFGYQNPYASASLLKIPPNFKSSALLAGPTPYVLGHGGAVVSSYNVNYPRYPYYSVKPYSNINPGLVGNFFIPRPVVAPTAVVPPNNILPANPVFPISPAVPSNFFVPHQPISHVPALSSVPAIATVPAKPVAALPFPGYFGTIPFGIQQSVIPIAVAGSNPTFATSVTAPNPTPAIIPGQGFRPILISPPTATPSSTIPRPAVSLVPPYGAPQRPQQPHPQQPEQGGTNVDEVQTPNRGYLVPNLQHRLVEQELLREQQQQQQALQHQRQQLLQQQQQQELLQQHQQAQQHQQLLQHQQSLLEAQESSGKSSSNQQGRYFGVSSYDVPLQGNKGYNY